ncbi:acid-sensing ion channel 3 isoform 4-T4 [Cyanocitta cristata]
MRRGSEGSGEGEGLSSLRAFAHSSSLHGISHVFAYGAVSLRRVLWGGFFLGSLGLLLLVCAERVAYFLTYPHVTKLDEVAARNLTFPAITICNLNEFRFSKITRNDMYHVGELLALLNERYEISNPQLAEPHVLAALRDKANFKNFKAKPFSMAEFYNRTGHDLAEMLLQCSFRGTGCTARNFTVIFTRLGKCYTFNPGGPGREVLTTLQGGSGNGLELMLNVQQEEYLPVWGDTDETSFEAGVKVQIHSQDEPPFIDQLGFGVAPGFQTFVSCQQQRLVYLPPPWGDCKATPIESDFFTNYSLTACRLDCETRYLAENCNCRMVHMPGNANVCTPEQYKECADPALGTYPVPHNGPGHPCPLPGTPQPPRAPISVSVAPGSLCPRQGGGSLLSPDAQGRAPSLCHQQYSWHTCPRWHPPPSSSAPGPSRLPPVGGGPGGPRPTHAPPRLPGDEGQRVLRVPHTLRHGALRQRALHGEDPQQGLGQVPGQEVQQDGAVHCPQHENWRHMAQCDSVPRHSTAP